VHLLKWFRHKPTYTLRSPGAWPLDLPLVRFSERPQDTWTPSELPGCIWTRRPSKGRYAPWQSRHEDLSPQRRSHDERVGIQGHRQETTYKHSISTSGSIHTAVGMNSQTSVTEVEEDSCAPKEFIGLKNGGKKNNYIVEGILFQSGRLWLKDQRWTVRRFRQDQL
jgi:hypothetical protein